MNMTDDKKVYVATEHRMKSENNASFQTHGPSGMPYSSGYHWHIDTTMLENYLAVSI